MVPVANWLILVYLGILLALVLFILRRPQDSPLRRATLFASLGVSALLLLMQLLAPTSVLLERLTPSFAMALLSVPIWGLFGAVLIRDSARFVRLPLPLMSVFQQLLRLWWGIIAAWGLALLLSVWLNASAYLGWSTWSETAPSLASVLAFGGNLLMGGALVALGLYWFYHARLPEIANRAAFWTVNTGLLLAGLLLIGSGSALLSIGGNLALCAALVAVVYASYRTRLPDTLAQVTQGAQTLMLMAVLWAVLFGVLYGISRLNLSNVAHNSATAALVALLALLISLALIPVPSLIQQVFKHFFSVPVPSPAQVIADYSRDMANASTLDEVARAATSALNKALGVRRSALILVGNTFRVPDAVELVMPAYPSEQAAYLSKKSPIFQALAIEKVPIGQYDLLYDALYAQVAPSERAFFVALNMQAYIPILSEGRVIGILAVGGKSNDVPFYRADMEILMIIGQQIGISLRSARLIDDLQHLNKSMRELNKRLDGAKRELEKLDSVKTDFVTIASHELRTPLAQIRGYTDILDSLSEQGALQKGQAAQMVGNLRRSTERMEELISAMLDMSQLDVNSMDLRFVRTTPETVVRMTIEPLKEALEQRKISVERSGFAGLPHIQADMQRLVQAFKNILLNAIKFTPDGGKVSISAQREGQGDATDTILFAFKDSGVGIAAKDLPYIFHKFYRGFDTQLHSTGIYKFMGAGPGLGLTIAKGIIEGHGGTIWAESSGHDMEKLPGSVFYVRLPIFPPEGQRVALPFDVDMPDERKRTSEMKSVNVDESLVEGQTLAHNTTPNNSQDSEAS